MTAPNAPGLRALNREIADAPDPHVVRIVATVDAMASRGSADALIAPLRPRLATLRPPRPLRFARLLFHPLDALIVPAARWRPDQNSIPRTAIAPMAEHVRIAMGADAAAIEARIQHRTTADTDIVARGGAILWPAASRILSASATPDTWERTELGPAVYSSLAACITALLGQAGALETMAAGTANGLLPPDEQRIAAILTGVAASHLPALPMMIALLLARVPESAAALPQAHSGATGVAVQAALDQAAERLLLQLDEDAGIEARIGSGSLRDAGVAAGWTASLLRQLDTGAANPRRRTHIQAIRKKLDADCKARFAAGLEHELLAPLNDPAPLAVQALEATARSLRALETEARTIGSGTTYDRLLNKAAEAIGVRAMEGGMDLVDQMRLVEILSGPEAAMALLE